MKREVREEELIRHERRRKRRKRRAVRREGEEKWKKFQLMVCKRAGECSDKG